MHDVEAIFPPSLSGTPFQNMSDSRETAMCSFTGLRRNDDHGQPWSLRFFMVFDGLPC